MQNGFLPLPPGKLATLVTHLEMTVSPGEPGPAPAGADLVRLRGADEARYRALFRAVGEPWLWFSRLGMDTARLRSILEARETEAFALVLEGRDVGLLELSFEGAPDSGELAFLGLVPCATGAGLGAWLVRTGAARVFGAGIARFTVHTCQLDDPRALGFYRRMGFVPTRVEIEILDDPRLTGLHPKTAAPHIPLIEGR